MNPKDSADQAAFRQKVRSWLANNLASYDIADPRDWHRRLFTAGLLGISWPTEYGGQDGDETLSFIFTEEYSRAKAPPLVNGIGLGWAGPAILLFGTDEQKSHYLPRILDATDVWCQLFSEPGAGSDLASVSTFATKTDTGWLLSGQKVWTTYARESDLGICLARTSRDVKSHASLTMFMIDMKQAGVEVRPLRQLDGRESFNEVFFTSAEAKETIGSIGEGWKVAIATLLFERVGLSAGAGALWGMGPTVEDLGHLGKDVSTQALGKVASDAFAQRALKLRMLTTLRRGAVPGTQASVQKLFGDQWGQRLVEAAFDARGLSGSVLDDWGRSLLYSRAMTIGGGTTEVQKNIIAERLLGLPKGM